MRHSGRWVFRYDPPRTILAPLLACLFLLLLTSCSPVRKQQALVYEPGRSLHTLSASVSLSLRSRGGNLSGNGVMAYRRPDRFHFAMLSPFGSTLLEAFALGERLTLVYPSQSLAFTGSFSELPEGSGMQGWRLLRWVMDAQPAAPSLNGSVERDGGESGPESVTYESGLVTSKRSSGGDRVSYENYSLVNGVPLPGGMEVRTGSGDRIRMVLDDPEVNQTLDDTSFTPRLEGMRVLPLSALPPAVPPGGGQ